MAEEVIEESAKMGGPIKGITIPAFAAEVQSLAGAMSSGDDAAKGGAGAASAASGSGASS